MNANEALERLASIEERQLTPQEAVEEATAVYVELAAEIDRLKEAQEAAKGVVNDVFVELGTDALDTAAGKAYVRKPYVRTSYDAKALDRLAEARPDIGALILGCRSQRMVAGTLVLQAHKGDN